MRKHFPCEHGCTIELGPDVPAYVMDANQTLHKYCLITQVGGLAVGAQTGQAGWGGARLRRGQVATGPGCDGARLRRGQVATGPGCDGARLRRGQVTR